jgi:hypothetical protein
MLENKQSLKSLFPDLYDFLASAQRCRAGEGISLSLSPLQEKKLKNAHYDFS